MLTNKEISFVNTVARRTAQETVSSTLSQLVGDVFVNSHQARQMLKCGKDKLRSLRDSGVIEYSKGDR